jgi:hypothetical protein
MRPPLPPAGNSSSVSENQQPRARRLIPVIPWVPLAITAVVLISALFPVAPLRDAATLGPVPEARLELPASYLPAAPVFDVFDTVTLLTVPQHVALGVTYFALYAAWRAGRRWRRRRGGAPPRSLPRALMREGLGAVAAVAVLFVVYALMALAPRPMARLVINDPDVLAVDVHAHTLHSHDGRSGWTAEHVRRWHEASGFNAFYVTDHRTFAGADEAIAGNPRLAGMGTVALSGLELVWRGERVNILGAGRTYRGLWTSDNRDMDEEALVLASTVAGREPVLVHTFPGNIERVIPAQGPGTAGVRAVEIIDGAPRGFTETRRMRSRIVELADSADLALVAASNNHGWGRTAPGWTLMRVRGWRAMTPQTLAMSIEGAIRESGRSSTRVAERRVGETDGPLLALTVPGVAWRMFTMLTTDQRLVWIAWSWGLWFAYRVARRRSRRTALG